MTTQSNLELLDKYLDKLVEKRGDNEHMNDFLCDDLAGLSLREDIARLIVACIDCADKDDKKSVMRAAENFGRNAKKHIMLDIENKGQWWDE